MLPGSRSLSADEHLDERLKVGPHISAEDLKSREDPVDFLDPETIVMCARTDLEGDTLGWFSSVGTALRHGMVHFASKGWSCRSQHGWT
jgi:hypothetical protein